ncbi:MAG: DUF3147 family protein [Myxococcota bacterium]
MFWIKAIMAGLIVAVAATLSERSPRFGALVVALPIISILTMTIMWAESNSIEKIAVHSESTFWLVLPSLPMFLILPWLLRTGWTYWTALGICILGTASLYLLMRQFFGGLP